MLEDASDFPGCHSSAVEENREQHAPSGSVRQRVKHGVIGIHSRFRISPRHSTLLSQIAKQLSRKYFAYRLNS
jgi:hypothetical protein